MRNDTVQSVAGFVLAAILASACGGDMSDVRWAERSAMTATDGEPYATSSTGTSSTSTSSTSTAWTGSEETGGSSDSGGDESTGGSGGAACEAGDVAADLDFATCRQFLTTNQVACFNACPGAPGSIERWRCDQDCSLTYYLATNHCCVYGRVGGEPIRLNANTDEARLCRATLCQADLTAQHQECMQTLDCMAGDPDFDEEAHVAMCNESYYDAAQQLCDPTNPGTHYTAVCSDGMRPTIPAGQLGAGSDAVDQLDDDLFAKRDVAHAFLQCYWAELFDTDVAETPWDERSMTPCRIRYIEDLIADPERSLEQRTRLGIILQAITY